MKKVMLITGASSGIGATVAKLAIAEGYAVAINYYKNPQKAEAVLASLEASPTDAIIIKADISTEQGVNTLFNTVDQRLGTLTALVNNAGVIAPISHFENMTLDRLETLFAINVFGSFLCAREAIKRMSTKHGGLGGAIVNVSSIAASLGSPKEFIDYAASKGAIDTLTVGLAKEVAMDNIRVNAVRPGLIQTEMHAHAGDADRPEKLKNAIPMGRPGDTEEVARAILWLLSDAASYVTGSLLDVSGGR